MAAIKRMFVILKPVSEACANDTLVPVLLFRFGSLFHVPNRTESISILEIDCQTALPLQIKEELFRRMPTESYVELRCYCRGRILDPLVEYRATT